jgi:hypothetical protein
MISRECFAWILVALLMLACLGSEWQRASLSVELTKCRAVEERLQEHNRRAIERFIDNMQRRGWPDGSPPSDEAAPHRRSDSFTR